MVRQFLGIISNFLDGLMSLEIAPGITGLTLMIIGILFPIIGLLIARYLGDGGKSDG